MATTTLTSSNGAEAQIDLPEKVADIHTSPAAAEKEEDFCDWPNVAGFETVYEQRSPVELVVSGSIPSYAIGTLYRTGPGTYKVDANDGKVVEASHWFDGLSQVHRFQILPAPDKGSPVKVVYNSRRTCDAHVEEIRRTGKFGEYTFGQKRDPCQSFFKKVMATFVPPADSGANQNDPSSQNIGVAVSINMPGLPYPDSALADPTTTGIRSLTVRTDNSAYHILNPETLEPAGVANQRVLHPDLKGPLSATHAKTCPVSGDIFNYNLEIAAKPLYRVFKVSAASQETTILATIDAPAAYIHSLFLTENYVVLCVWNSRYAFRGAVLLYHKNVLDTIAKMDKSKPCKWYVVDRKSDRGLVATYETPAMFAFHTVNAFEEQSKSKAGETDLILDVSCYDDISVLKRFYYDNMTSQSPGASKYALTTNLGHTSRTWLARFRLADIPSTGSKSDLTPRAGERVFAMDRLQSVELPTLNAKYVCKPYRYAYGVTDRGNGSFFDGLAKVDLTTQKTIFWQQKGHTGSEPIFVANPEGSEEDDGVLLSVVLDGFKEKSYLLCLNAKDMTELGRAEVDGVVGFGFHGAHVPSRVISSQPTLDL